MKKIVNNLSEKLDFIIGKVIVVLFVILLFDVWFAVLDRYLFKFQMMWTEEIARYLMVWTMLLAIASATARRQHVFISFVIDVIPEKFRIIVYGILDILTVLFFFYVSWLGLDFIQEGKGLTTSVYGMSFTIPYASVAVAFFLSGIQSLLITIRDFGTLPSARNELTSIKPERVF